MKIESTDVSATTIQADAIAIGIWKDQPLQGPAQQVDQATGGAISKLIEMEEVSADLLSTSTLLAPAGVAAPIVLVVGLGKQEDTDQTFSARVGGLITKSLGSKSRQHVAVYIDVPKVDELVCGLLNGCVGQDLFLEKKKLHPNDMM